MRSEAFTSFQPAMSREKLIEKSREVRRWRLHRRPNDTLDDLARAINPIVRGWMTYWGRFYRTEMDPLLTPHQHLPDAMGPKEIQAVAWVQTSQGVVERGHATGPHTVRALDMDTPIPSDWMVRAE